MKNRLGKLESLILAYVQMRKIRIVRVDDLVAPLRLTKNQLNDALQRLTAGKMTVRIRPGVYLVPMKLPLGGTWTPDEALAINALMEDASARYQICGPNLFNKYGFDEQIPNRVYLYNDKLSGERKIGTVEMVLIKVSKKRLGETENVTSPDGEVLVYGSRARALLDAIYDWSRFEGIPRGYAWIRKEIASKRIKISALIRCLLSYGDVGTMRRTGYLLEQLKVQEKYVRQIEKRLKPTVSKIAWIPNRPKKGKYIKRWGIVDNSRKGDLNGIYS